MKERLFDKEKMSERKQSELVFCLFGSLTNKWFVGSNDKKICLEKKWQKNLYAYIFSYNIYAIYYKVI